MKYIIFDFDGTIADTFPLIRKLFMRLKDEYKEYASEEFDLDEVRNKDAREILRKFKIPIYKLPPIISRVKKEMQIEIPKEAGTFPGIKRVLENLSKKYRLGILSSNSEENIKLFLSRNNLSSYFDFIYSDSSLFGKDKTIKAMLKDRKINPREMIYVGDEQRDILACRKLKIPIIVVTWGFNSEEFLMKEKPAYIARKPEDVERIVPAMKTAF